MHILRADPVCVAADALPVHGDAASHQLVTGEVEVALDSGAELIPELSVPSILTHAGHAGVRLKQSVMMSE